MSRDYRLYYNDDGSLFCYSMEILPNKKYLHIDSKTYSEALLNVKVIDGKIVKLKRNRMTSVYEKSTTGIQTSKYDINILTEQDPSNYWLLKTHDNINSDS